MDLESCQVSLDTYKLIFLDKAYLMNVVNTLDPGLIIKTIKSLQEEKKKKTMEESNIEIRSDWL
jgi:hypothetical protein